ncbi:hypothetical protein NEOLEDRAFT_1245628 [Neolentinus lepideus HHB14362 ss-1]|uniref:CNH domain-containing protein n=1 Tax=Neolentinus lepideus HHB14362 ss-1 TaxID=1314782 RepID=A0A165NL47_9AGAM|nr:hypothetical protein NEOLEDRAFT_1245628 [Neolentinus lepideus HHB14362 ss-1]
MAPFLTPKVAVTGLTERVESLAVQGDRLYIGTVTGSVSTYSLDESPDHDDEVATLVETKKNLVRRSIEQLGFIKDINSLVVLSESSITLFPLPNFAPPTPLQKAKAAFSFAIYSSIQHISDTVDQSTTGDFERPKSIPTLVTYLAAGCRRKLVIYSWKDGEAQQAKEVPLPHSPRTMAFMGHEAICLAYSSTEFALYSLTTNTVSDLTIPQKPAMAAAGVGALTGLSSYMTLALGAKAKPCMAKISEKEVLLVKDNAGIFFGPDGKPSRTATVDWPGPPDEFTYVKPYVLSALPPGTAPTSTSDSAQSSLPQSSVIQIRSGISLSSVQTITFPFTSSTAPHSTVRLLTPSSTAKATSYFVTTPVDRNAAASEGSSVWLLRMRPWMEQIDELVEAGAYADALALLESIDSSALPDKDKTRARIRALHAVSQFRAGIYDEAINTFISLEVNPAKVVALYPENVAGRLSVPADEWIPLFGGPRKVQDSTSSQSDLAKDKDTDSDNASTHNKSPGEGLPDRTATPVGSIREKLKTSLDAFMPSGSKDPETASISSVRRRPKPDAFHRSVETLLQYLPDRRPKIAAALAAVHITPSQAHRLSPLSEASAEELFSLPDAPLSSLTPDQLLRFAQVVDTALFKSYLIVRPPLLGPLCRAENWCEVSEVEEVLRSREKFSELIDLYNGKKMHEKALALLKQLSEKEDDMEDKLMPSITYLQRLGPEYLDQVFESSQWLFEKDANMAFQIFTSEQVELPRKSVADFLETINPTICARYLEYLLEEKEERDPSFHDRLAEVYLHVTLHAKEVGDDGTLAEYYDKFLRFLDSNDYYRVEHIFGMLPMEDLFEARAILLGKLGRHQHALEIYVYRLNDYGKAEAYCKRIYQADSPTSGMFLTLLRIYLRPTVQMASNLLQPALDLITRHGPRLDSAETLQLLPPLVTAKDVRAFLIEALRVPIFDSHVIREISKARNEQVARKLMVLQSNRVKVTDSRICPQCHKRLGNSVIAVHAPRGEVTHYQCREAFAGRLNEIRR